MFPAHTKNWSRISFSVEWLMVLRLGFADAADTAASKHALIPCDFWDTLSPGLLSSRPGRVPAVGAATGKEKATDMGVSSPEGESAVELGSAKSPDVKGESPSDTGGGWPACS